jgi:predicted RNA-binding protein
MTENYSRPRSATILVLLPFNRGVLRAADQQSSGLEKLLSDRTIHVCLYGTPYGLIPIEISDVYPLAQTEFSSSMDSETEQYALDQIREYVATSRWEAVIVYATKDSFSRRLVSLLRRLPGRVSKRVEVTHGEGSPWSTDASMLLLNTARKRRVKARR